MKQPFASVVSRMLVVIAAWIISGGCTNYVSQTWNNREIIFPTDLHFLIANEPFDLSQGCFSYSIVNYIDSGGCKCPSMFYLNSVEDITVCESIGWWDNDGNCVKNSDTNEYFCKMISGMNLQTVSKISS